MVKIADIESSIRKLVRTDEEIVYYYDSRLLCRDYDETKDKLKQLVEDKEKLIKSLESDLNEFLNIKPKSIFKFLKIGSFRLSPTLINCGYKFDFPYSVNRNSREFYCFISMMDKLVREYDIITKNGEDYYILDITERLGLNKLLGDKFNHIR